MGVGWPDEDPGEMFEPNQEGKKEGATTAVRRVLRMVKRETREDPTEGEESRSGRGRLVERPRDGEDTGVAASEGVEGTEREVERSVAASGAGVGDDGGDRASVGGVLDRDVLSAVGASVDLRGRERDEVGVVRVVVAARSSRAVLGEPRRLSRVGARVARGSLGRRLGGSVRGRGRLGGSVRGGRGDVGLGRRGRLGGFVRGGRGLGLLLVLDGGGRRGRRSDVGGRRRRRRGSDGRGRRSGGLGRGRGSGQVVREGSLGVGDLSRVGEAPFDGLCE